LGNLPFMTVLAKAAPRAALRRALLLGLAVFAALLLIPMLLPARREPPSPPLPNPNGYDDFLKAASLMTGDFLNASSLGHDDLRALVASNAQALALARLGLSRECSVHTDSVITNFAGQLDDLAGLKKLGMLLGQEGRLAERENRNADAVRCYMDAIRFGNEVSRGGVIIHRFSGLAVERIAWISLANVVPKLTYQEARPVVPQLEKADDTAVAWDEVLSHEHRFVKDTTAGSQWSNPIEWTTVHWQIWQSNRRAHLPHKIAAAHLRLLATELALRCYQASKGRPAARLDDLVPEYLAKVPHDPFSRHALVYRPQGTNWLLYSVGPDGVDDGGRPVVIGSKKGDILFNSPL
jgi:hypothetical protein